MFVMLLILANNTRSQVTDTVHANGSFVYLQLWALGRTATEDILKREGLFDVVSAGDIGIADHAKPRPLTLEEIESYKFKYAIAAKNAIAAGFDGSVKRAIEFIDTR